MFGQLSLGLQARSQNYKLVLKKKKTPKYFLTITYFKTVAHLKPVNKRSKHFDGSKQPM